MTGQVLFNGDQSDPFKVSNKVKQGCVLAPILFNLLFTCILRQAMQDFEEGVYIDYCYDGSIFDLHRLSVKTKTLTSLLQEVLYAVDCALITHKAEDQQTLLGKKPQNSLALSSVWEKQRCFSNQSQTLTL